MENGHKSLKRSFSLFIFWGYNLIYLIVVVLILLNASSGFFGRNVNLMEILTFGGSFPTNVLVMIYGFILTPFAAMALGCLTKLRKAPENLIRLFFGFEIPLMGLILIRIVFLRQVTPVVWLFFLGIVLSVCSLLVHLFFPQITSKAKLTFLMLSQQIAIVVASYALLLAFFFLPIIAAMFIKMLPNIRIGEFIRNIPTIVSNSGILPLLLYLFVMVLFFLTAGFLTLGPIGAFITFWRNCRQLYTKLVHAYGLNYSRWARYGVSSIYILLAVLLSIQVNVNSYTNLITNYRAANTFEQKQQVAGQIAGREKEIRDGITSSYLAQYRYLSDGKMNLLQQGYKNELGAAESTAQSIQQLFNTIALPFMYRGTFEEDIKTSSENYTELFDNAIQKGELSAISKTLQSANTQDSLKAGILDFSKKTVKLVSKVVNVAFEHDGLLATVTIEEEYENSFSRVSEEVCYEFSLPDNAVITELKLGPDLAIGADAVDKPVSPSAPTPQGSTPPSLTSPAPTPAEIDNAVVAPKGAASTTYERQIFRRSDPALLAQVGPRQYKLRIFPIPAKGQTLDGRFTTLPQKNQKVRYSYVTLVSSDGIALPVISEQRNVFADKSTKITHTIDGKESRVPSTGKDNLRFIPLSRPLPCLTNALETQTPVGAVIFIPHSINPALATFYSCQNGFAHADRTVSGLHIALLLDSSYSNPQKDWNTYLTNTFPASTWLKNNTVDLYYFNDTVSQKTVLTADVLKDGLRVINIGRTDRSGAIGSLASGYDLILMVTDASIFDVKPEGRMLATTTPIYIIQPDDTVPPYHDVLTNAVIQSNGKVVQNGTQALNHYWQQVQVRMLDQLGTVLDTNELGTWMLLNNGNQDSLVLDFHSQMVDMQSPFSVLAEKRIIMESIREAGQSVASLDFLDKIHDMSQQSFIVTPYSAMIVLVTEEQKRQLSSATKENNRYQLALDTGEEPIGNPSGKGILEIGAVPEPHEWLLMFAAGILLVYVYRSRLALILQPLYESNRSKIKKN